MTPRPKKTVVITQSNYIPWRGYFDLIRQADAFVIFDTVQYTRHDWRNRNQIKTRTGLQWLTVPIRSEFGQSIDHTQIAGAGWMDKHIRTIDYAYRAAPAFGEISPWLFALMREAAAKPLLSQCNEHLLVAITRQLGIQTPFCRSETLIERGEMEAMERTDRAVRICEAAGATRYLCGPAAQSYIDTARFEAHGIEFAWMNYDGYREYPQCWGAFEPRVSIVDLLLNCGDQAAAYLERHA